MIKYFVIALLFSHTSISAPEGFILTSKDIQKRVDFWKKVYTIVSSEEGFIHDAKDLSIIYQRVSLPGKSRRSNRRFIKNIKRKLKKRLFSIAKKKPENYSEEDGSLLAAMGSPRRDRLRSLALSIRWQQGMSDRFREGLKRSFLYLDHIVKIFKEEGVPIELALLPHVESSFNYRAYSKVGAAGIWQFMRSSGRLFKLKINYLIDERLDPIKASRAAARHLKSNFKILKEWPLAITAYNHGVNGMRRAAKSMGTKDLSEIIENYKGRRFGFASKNFYASYLAALDISSHYQKYFGSIRPHVPIFQKQVHLKRALGVNSLAKAVGMKLKDFKDLNRQIRPAVFRRNLNLPRGITVNIQGGLELEKVKKSIARIVVKKRHIQADLEHKVRRGENLYTISRLYQVNLSDLIEVNRLASPNNIRAGQKVMIPASNRQKVKSLRVKKRKIVVVPKEMAEAKISGVVKKRIMVGDPDVGRGYNFSLRNHYKGAYKISVEVDETLGHYADWLKVSIRKIRSLNNFSRRRSIRLGMSLVLPISAKQVLGFQVKRIRFHQGIEEDFFGTYAVTKVGDYKVRKGDTVEKIIRRNDIPLWLFKKYNTKKKSFFIARGEKLSIPIVTNKVN